jgi:type I restriction enzyme S subunit
VSWSFPDIGSHVDKISTWNPSQSVTSEAFRYIDLSSVDKDKKIISLKDVPLINQIDAPSRARQLVKATDVLVATVRPNLNGVAVVPDELDGATASTGYCVLRTDNSTLDFRYLYHWVKTNSFVDDMMKKATGANYPAVSDKIIKESKIPLPPLAEQKRIAAILDKADSLRRKNQQAIQLADQFLRTVFLDMFGDPVINPKRWDVKKLKQGIISIRSGWSANGESIPCNSDQLGVLKISAVTSGVFKASENKYVPSETIPKNKALIFPKKGDLLFSRANTRELVAATCIVPENNENVFLPDKLWKVEINKEKLLPEFLHYSIQQPRFRDLLTSQATGTSGSMLNISKAKFEETDIIFPDICAQKRFAEIYWKIQSVIFKLNLSNSYSFDGFNALSQKAFSGHL